MRRYIFTISLFLLIICANQVHAQSLVPGDRPSGSGSLAPYDCKGVSPTPYPIYKPGAQKPPRFFDLAEYIKDQQRRADSIIGLIPAIINGNIRNINELIQRSILEGIGILESLERELYHGGNTILGIARAFLQHILAMFGPFFFDCLDFEMKGVCWKGTTPGIKVHYNFPTEVGDIGQALTTAHIWTLLYDFFKPMLESDALYMKAPMMAVGEIASLSRFIPGGAGIRLGLPKEVSEYTDLRKVMPEALRFAHSPFPWGWNLEPHLVPAFAQAVRHSGVLGKLILPQMDFLPSSLSDLGLGGPLPPELQNISDMANQVQDVVGTGMQALNIISNIPNISNLSQVGATIGSLGVLAETNGINNIPYEDLQKGVNDIMSVQNLFASLTDVGSVGGIVGSLNQLQQTSVQLTGDTIPELGTATTVMQELGAVAPVIQALGSINSPEALLGMLGQLQVTGSLPLLGRLSNVLTQISSISQLASLAGVMSVLSELNIAQMLGLNISEALGTILSNPVAMFGAYIALGSTLPASTIIGALTNVLFTCHGTKLPDHVLFDSPFTIDFSRFPSLSALLDPELYRGLLTDPLMCIRADLDMNRGMIGNALPHLAHALYCIDPSLGFNTELPKETTGDLCIPNMGAKLPYTSFVDNLMKEIAATKQTIKVLEFSKKKTPGSVFNFNTEKSKFQFVYPKDTLGGRCYKADIDHTEFKKGEVHLGSENFVVQHWSYHECCLL